MKPINLAREVIYLMNNYSVLYRYGFYLNFYGSLDHLGFNLERGKI